MKRIIKLILIIMILCPSTVFAEYSLEKTTHGTYEKAQEIIKEVMRSYYLRGSNIQYNFSKTTYPIGAPEEATSQDINNSVCAAFTYSVHNQAFGMKYDSKSSYKKFPRYNYDIYEQAYAYYKDKIETKSGSHKPGDGTFLIYYQHSIPKDHSSTCEIDNIRTEPTDSGYEGEKIKYVYGDTTPSSPTGDYETLVNNLRPGDLVVYTGHALIVYDTIDKNNDGKKDDAIILNSTQSPYIKTRIEGTSNLSYNMFQNSNGNNGIIDVPKEGTLKYKYLSQMEEFVNENGTLTCSEHECAVLRTFYEDSNGNAVFNYKINENQYNKSVLRTKYPGMLIEKTVDKGDNNTINLGEELTYNIKITNKSSSTYANTTYGKFTVEETIEDDVTIKETNGTIDESSGVRKIIWNINSMSANQTQNLSYKIQVKNVNKQNETITATGKVYDPTNPSVYISTGTVKNPVRFSSGTRLKSFASCHEEVKNNNSKGLAYVDEMYNCVYGENNKVKLDGKFSFNNLFEHYLPSTTTGDKDPKPNLKFGIRTYESNSPTFSNMILNNYYSGTYYYNGNANKKGYYLARFTETPKRARSINSSDFQNGDILIYYVNSQDTPKTNESGYYAYVYVKNQTETVDEFIGRNGVHNKTDQIYTLRNKFVHQYYAKSYAMTGDNEGNSRHASEETCNKLGLSQGVECNYKTYLYEKYGASGVTDDVLKYINYQTLFDKDYYVILRPSLLSDISFTKPTKTEYVQNQGTLDLTGAKLTIKDLNGSSDTIDLTTSNTSISGFDITKSGNQKVTLSYGDYEMTYDVNITPTYTLTYNDNGKKENHSYQAQEKIDLKANLTKEGYTLVGWEYNNACYSVDTKFTMPDKDVTLNVIWQANKYQVTYDKLGTSFSVTYDLPYGQLREPEKKGYTFKGWYLNSTLTTPITQETIVKTTQDHTLYAKWEVNKYNVVYNAMGGTVSKTNFEVTYDSKYGNLDTPVKNGYTFKGWYLENTYENQITKDSIVSTSSNHTLYAKFQANQYTVNYNSAGGTLEVTSNKVTYDSVYGDLPETTKENCRFVNWYLEDTYENEVLKETTVKTASNHTLYAKWIELGKYEVSYKPNGGTGKMDIQEFTEDTSGKLNSNKYIREGYEFKGWNTKPDGTGTFYNDEKEITISEDLTLYAIWEELYSYIIDHYIQNKDKKFIDLIDINTIVDEFLKNIKLNTEYTVDVNYVTINAKKLLYTGGKTKIFKKGELFSEYTNIIRGEVNGDGKIDYTDYVKVYNHIYKAKNPSSTKTLLTNEYLVAADMSQDEKVDYMDYVKVYNKIKELKGGAN